MPPEKKQLMQKKKEEEDAANNPDPVTDPTDDAIVDDGKDDAIVQPVIVDPNALTDNTWPDCGDLACTSEFYLNPLACQCFVRSACSVEESGCVVGVTDLLPTEQCTCAPYSDIKALYPAWASLGDVNKATTDGLEAALKAD